VFRDKFRISEGGFPVSPSLYHLGNHEQSWRALLKLSFQISVASFPPNINLREHKKLIKYFITEISASCKTHAVDVTGQNA